MQDVFQFGIVIFFCLFGILPWQRADQTSDPNFSEFCIWRRKRTSKIPKNFKPLSSRAQKMFKKLLDPDPERRLRLNELPKYTGDDLRWLRKGGSKSLLSSPTDSRMPTGMAGTEAAAQHFLSDGISQLTMGSFQSVHSNAVEKNKVLYTLLQHGVETTVDRSQKNSRIIHWIQHGRTSDPDELLRHQVDNVAHSSASSSGDASDEAVGGGLQENSYFLYKSPVEKTENVNNSTVDAIAHSQSPVAERSMRSDVNKIETEPEVETKDDTPEPFLAEELEIEIEKQLNDNDNQEDDNDPRPVNFHAPVVNELEITQTLQEAMIVPEELD